MMLGEGRARRVDLAGLEPPSRGGRGGDGVERAGGVDAGADLMAGERPLLFVCAFWRPCADRVVEGIL